MRWLRSAGMFVLAIVLALAFVSTPLTDVDLQDDMMFTTQIVDLSPEIVNLPARVFDVGTTDAAMIASYVALARSSDMDADEHLEDLLMFESAYHRNVGYPLLNFTGTMG